MSEEERLSLNNYMEDLYQAMQIGNIVYEPKRSAELYNLINKVLEENKKYKEEKRLILKDIKEWIACAKNEELEGYKTHLEYWEMFETILRKIFTKYNTENISDDDLKYNHYLEKENEDLILENKKYKEVINGLKDYLKARIEVCDNKLSTPFCNFEKATKERLILSQCLEKLEELEVEHEKIND